MFSPANAVYEILIGLGCLGTAVTLAITIPFICSMIITEKEEKERLS